MSRVPAVAARNNAANENVKTKPSSKSTRPSSKSSTREVLTNITNNQKPSRSKSTKSTDKLTDKPSKASKKAQPVVEPQHCLTVTQPEPESKKHKAADPMAVDDEVHAEQSASVSMETNDGANEPAWDDIDGADNDDTQAVVEYVNDIYEFMMGKERAERLSTNFLAHQVEVNEKMRAILVDWLAEVHHMFKLLPETLFLTVFIIDRYLEKATVTRDKLQLVGITSMLIGAKYEEIYAPECNDFVHVSDGAYEKEQILETEQTILNTLEFNLTCPSALHFLRRYSKAAGSDYSVHTLCKYLIELSLVDIKLLKFLPSQIAAGSVYVARAMTQKTQLWTPTLQHYSTYTEEEVRVVAVEINTLLKKAQKSSLKAIQKKYSLEKYGEVATIPLVDL